MTTTKTKTTVERENQNKNKYKRVAFMGLFKGLLHKDIIQGYYSVEFQDNSASLNPGKVPSSIENTL